MHNSKNIQEPQNHENDHDSIQDRLNGARHRYVVVDEPEENTLHYQNHQDPISAFCRNWTHFVRLIPAPYYLSARLLCPLDEV